MFAKIAVFSILGIFAVLMIGSELYNDGNGPFAPSVHYCTEHCGFN